MLIIYNHWPIPHRGWPFCLPYIIIAIFTILPPAALMDMILCKQRSGYNVEYYIFPVTETIIRG